jgi:hypothetical protein
LGIFFSDSRVKDASKEIILQILGDATVAFFSNFQQPVCHVEEIDDPRFIQQTSALPW